MTGKTAISEQQTANSGRVTADAPGLQHGGDHPLQYLPISGPSMIPSLRPLDLLEVMPYGERPVQVGDVVAFLQAGKKIHIVHRVVEIGPAGIRTLGDNNLFEDTVDLEPEDLTGRVIAAWRGKKRSKVHGGSAGRLIAYAVRVICKLDRVISRLLRPVYHALARNGALQGLLPNSLKPRVVRFGSPEQQSMMLLFLGRSVGQFDIDLQRWVIRRPFRLFINETMLSELSVDPSE